jgi:LacI family transcriptional regulator
MADSITRKDVANYANVSETTVSFVVSGKWPNYGISRNTYEKVIDAVKKLGYEPNRAARELRGAKTGRVGLIIWALDRPFYLPLLEAFHHEAIMSGYALLIYLQKNERSMDMLVKDALTQTDAVFIDGECSEAFTEELVHSASKPIAFMNHRPVAGHYTIVTDPAEKVYMATKHLVDQGYRNLYFASNNENRIPGFKQALAERGIPFTVEMLVAHGAYDFSHGERLAQEISIDPQGYTGVVAANDAVAIGCMHHLVQKGFRAGRDYGIVGFDTIAAGAYLEVPLSSVCHDYTTEAKNAFKVLENDTIAAGQSTVVHVKNDLIERESSRRVHIAKR